MCTADVVLCKHCVTSAVYKSATALSLLQKSCLYYVLSASVLDLTIYFRPRLTYFHISIYFHILLKGETHKSQTPKNRTKKLGGDIMVHKLMSLEEMAPNLRTTEHCCCFSFYIYDIDLDFSRSNGFPALKSVLATSVYAVV